MNKEKKLSEERGQRLAKHKEKENKKAPYVSTGSTMLDLSLGGGDALSKGGMGEKVGNILNIAGDSSSGKSFLACEIIANAKKAVESGKLLDHGISKIKWVLNDVESGFNFNDEELWGFTIQPSEKAQRFSTRTVEKCGSHIQTSLKSLKDDELLIYVIDSWDALSSDDMVKRNDERVTKHKKDEEYDKGTMGMAKNKHIASEFFGPIQTLMMEKNCILILVSQLRDNVGAGMFEKKWRISSEAVMKYYCDTRIMLKTAEKYMEQDKDEYTGETHTRWVGSSVLATPLKTRHSRPCREVQYDVRFDYGVDDTASCVDFLYGLREEKTRKVRTGENVKNLSFPPKPPGDTYTKLNLGNLREWLKEMLPEAGVKTTTSKETMEQLIVDHKLQAEHEKKFGSGLDRNGMIEYVFDNELEDKLIESVVAKWERIESKFVTKKRRPKY